MSIENERKYIINLKREDADWICRDYIGKWQILQQAYINNGRIRKIRQYKKAPQYIFTWKVRRPDYSSIEIETEISERDFNELWGMATTTILKYRVKLKGGCGVEWDIDFLEKYDIMNGEISGNHYLTIAEVEMPEGWDEPKTLPSFVKDNLLFLVPREDDKFWTNKNLSNPEKVKQMLKSMKPPTEEETKRAHELLNKLRECDKQQELDRG